MRLFPLFCFSFFWALNSQATLIFPKEDPHLQIKKQAISEIEAIMGSTHSSLTAILDSDRVILWANEARLFDEKQVTVPSFAAVSVQNEFRLRLEMERLCGCSLKDQAVGGILIASPYHAAEMHFRKDWAGHGSRDVDGFVPPIVVIYHEMSHARDYLSGPEFFFDWASNLSRRWKNQAEQSATEQQNDFVNALSAKKGLHFDLRRSYGTHRLYLVEGLYSTQPVSHKILAY